MKILAFNGSPRVGGNTSDLIDQALAGARTINVTVEKVNLNELGMRGCQSHEACRRSGVCIEKDAFWPYYKKIDDADGLIIASPIYMGRITGQTKCFIDRLYPYMDENFKSRMRPGKRAVLAMVWAASGEGQGREELEYWAKFFANHVEIVAKIGVPGMTRLGAFKHNKAAMDEAFKAGVKLAGGK